ncbi:MAG: FAD-binding oxidoreductase [Geothrix sp.]|nr:FAD-binding oxidoreductase [Geothrix sp.]
MPCDLASLRRRLEDLVGTRQVEADPGSNAAFAVDGLVPALTVRPGTQDEVAAVVAACAAEGAALVPWGGGTAMGTGNRPDRMDVVVRLDRLDRVVEFDPDNLCVTVEAGLPLARLQALIAGKQLILPLDPPEAARVTLGGLVAANLSGPHRLQHGTARDWVLGMRVVLPDGERIRCGGRVIKNVSGYDMNKLFIRSFGTLGIVTEVTLKLLPMPAARASVLGLFPELSGAAAVVEKVLASFLLPEALDLLDPAALELLAPTLGPGTGGHFALAAGFAGSPATVQRQVRDLEALITKQGGTARHYQEAGSLRLWGAIADMFGALPAAPHPVLCTLAVPIGRTAGMMASARARAADHGLGAVLAAHAGSGILRAALLPGAGASGEAVVSEMAAALDGLREEASALGGSLVLQEAPPSLKARVDAWGRPGSAFAVMRRIKAEFDPQGLCSPGRFLGGL